MSTRCQIAIHTTPESTDWSFIYHHHDGYPDGVGADLVELLKTFDGDWTADRLLEHFSSKDSGYSAGPGPIRFDSEYVYIITCSTKQLKCYGKGITNSDGDFDLECPGHPLEIEGNVFSEPTFEEPEKLSENIGNVDWLGYRLELVKHIAQGLVSHSTYMSNIASKASDEFDGDNDRASKKIIETIAADAVEIADGIIVKLKKQ